jgi:hypothetical protein
MSANSQPTLDTLPDMRSAGAKIADYAREKLDGIWNPGISDDALRHKDFLTRLP